MRVTFSFIAIGVVFLNFSCGSDLSRPVSSNNRNWRVQETKNMTQDDFWEMQKLKLEHNRNFELQEGWALREEVERKYGILNDTVDKIQVKYRASGKGAGGNETSCKGAGGDGAGGKRTSGKRTGIKDVCYHEMKDIPLVGPDFDLIYHPLVLREVTRVFTDIGHLYIKEDRVKNDIKQYNQVEVAKPWSGYWYPFSNDMLYTSIAKFEDILKGKGIDTSIVREEKERYHGMVPYGWEGRCDSLSVAAILTQEPKQAITIGSTTLTIADIKALHIFAHQRYPIISYGIPYLGDETTDGTFQNLKPEAFHRIVEYFLGEKKHGIAMDTGAGVQKWYRPLFRYRWFTSKDPEIENAFLVKAYAFLMRERNNPSDALTTDNDIMAPIFEYRLYVDKAVTKNGKYKVIAGQWLRDSFKNHPDTVRIPKQNEKPASPNSEFNKYIDHYLQLILRQ